MVFKKLLSHFKRQQSLSLQSSEVLYAVGDIHGKLNCLMELMDKVLDDLKSVENNVPTHLIFLGDYVDRGEDSCGVLEYLSKLSKKNTAPFDKITFLKGNHEDLMLSFINNPDFDSWLDHGGLETLVSYGIPDLLAHMRAEDKTDLLKACVAHIPDAHLDFLYNDLEISYTSGQIVFCHAGVDPYETLSRQHDRTFMWGHPEFMQQGGLDGHTVVHGHYIRKSPDIGKNRIGVDTGAYHTGVLSAVKIKDGEYNFITTKIN
jgi:serine/threonine protein phosphatase 1